MVRTINIATTRGITSADGLSVIFAPHNDSDETVATTIPQRDRLGKPCDGIAESDKSFAVWQLNRFAEFARPGH
jgi:hypothetical protein